MGLGCVAVAAASVAGVRRAVTKDAAAGRSAKGGAVTALRAFENEIGVQPPTGFWDPAGFTSDGDAAEFKRRRCVEIKHGRISMLACIGYIVPEYYKWPGYISPSSGIKFADIPNGLAAFSKVPALGWGQMVGLALQLELFGAYQQPNDEPGRLTSRFMLAFTEVEKQWFNQYQFGPYGLINGEYIKDPVVKRTKLHAELANGRLAMTAIMSMMFQNGTVGTTGPEMWLGANAFENEIGVQPPTGFWDPAGFTSDGDAAEFKRRRCVEIKHGRISMLACIGYIVPEYYKWPGYISPSSGIKFADIPNGLAAFSKVPALGWGQMVGLALQLELFGAYQQPNDEPGRLTSRFMLAFTEVEKQWFNQYQFGPYGLINGEYIKDPVLKKTKLNAELANGRLAMTAIMAMMFQNGTVGTTGPEMWLGANAFENEIGVQPPTGFWDPAGFTSDGDAAEFKRRRCVEIKHGRISMLACIGYIVPEYYKWPGYISPSSGIKFADIPNGLAAFSKVPALGWGQMVGLALQLELFGAYQQPNDEPGRLTSRFMLAFTEVEKQWFNQYQFGPYGLINGEYIKDPVLKKTKLNAELANGRLAMTAIMAMMFQNGTVGTTGPEMWLGAN
jgi:hypothetical protein